MGLDLRTLELRPEPKADAQSLSHPGAPIAPLLKCERLAKTTSHLRKASTLKDRPQRDNGSKRNMKEAENARNRTKKSLKKEL